MANTATITKQSVEKLNTKDYRVTVHVVIRNTANEIILEQDYSERYFSDLSVGDIKLKLQSQIAADWDEYITEQNIYNAAAFDTMVNQIQTAANSYINA